MLEAFLRGPATSVTTRMTTVENDSPACYSTINSPRVEQPNSASRQLDGNWRPRTGCRRPRAFATVRWPACSNLVMCGNCRARRGPPVVLEASVADRRGRSGCSLQLLDAQRVAHTGAASPERLLRRAAPDGGPTALTLACGRSRRKWSDGPRISIDVNRVEQRSKTDPPRRHFFVLPLNACVG